MDAGKRAQLQKLQKAIVDEFVETLSVVVLVQGALEDGKPHYAYVRIPKDRYRDFKRAEATGSYDVRAYGEVLAHGEGLDPPESVRTQMRTQYGAHHLFEEELLSSLTALEQGMFHTETEDKAS